MVLYFTYTLGRSRKGEETQESKQQEAKTFAFTGDVFKQFSMHNLFEDNLSETLP